MYVQLKSRGFEAMVVVKDGKGMRLREVNVLSEYCLVQSTEKIIMMNMKEDICR